MAVPDTKGFRVKKGNETGISKIATEAILDKAVTKAKLAQAVQDEIDHKADQDGDCDSLTAGGAKQLLSTVYVEDKVPYNFRTSGGTAGIGDRMYDEVVGGSIVWNQLIRNGNFANGTTSWGKSSGTISASNGILTLTPTGQYGSAFTQVKLVSGHVYMFAMDFYSSVAVRARVYASSKWFGVYYKDIPAATWYPWAEIARASEGSSSIGMIIQNNNPSDYGEQQIKNVVFIDFTAMFGSTIADYILSLETATAGAGVAWFRNLFPKPYYEYNAGELMSVKAGSHDTVGFNAWDEETELGIISTTTGENTASTTQLRSKNYIPVVPNSTYYVNVANTSSLWIAVLTYDANKNFISNLGGKNSGATFTTPSNCSFVRFYVAGDYGKTYKNDICINLAWDGERNGEYEPYEKHTYPLSNIELRGIPKLDANNQLYYDGDTYASDGTVTRKWAIVDLGSVNWSYAGESWNAFYHVFADKKNGTENLICSKYTKSSVYATETDKIYLGNANSGTVYIRDESFNHDTTTFKTAMSGVYLVYELAEPTTETADSFVSPQVVNDFGTEEYTDFAVEAGDRDVAIPVGHNSQYMNNLRAKLEMAPDSPDGDGDYIVRQSNGENSYVPYTADGRLTALEAKLPAPPSENGTYKLTATVTDGGVTYTWTAG